MEREIVGAAGEPREDDSRAEIHVSVVTFGKDGAKVHQPLAPAAKVQWTRMTAAGGTPMGAAFDAATGMIEDRAQIPMYLGYAFRAMNTHGRALFTLAHRAMAGQNEDDYVITDGERICSTAIGWNFAGDTRTVCPCVASCAMPPTNSKNCVARTMV